MITHKFKKCAGPTCCSDPGVRWKCHHVIKRGTYCDRPESEHVASASLPASPEPRYPDVEFLCTYTPPSPPQEAREPVKQLVELLKEAGAIPVINGVKWTPPSGEARELPPLDTKIKYEPITYQDAIDGLNRIHCEVQRDFNDQWNWIDAGFYVEVLHAALDEIAAKDAEIKRLRDKTRELNRRSQSLTAALSDASDRRQWRRYYDAIAWCYHYEFEKKKAAESALASLQQQIREMPWPPYGVWDENAHGLWCESCEAPPTGNTHREGCPVAAFEHLRNQGRDGKA